MIQSEQTPMPDEKSLSVGRDWVLRFESGEMSAEDNAAFKNWISQSPLNKIAFDYEYQRWNSFDRLKEACAPSTWQDDVLSEELHNVHQEELASDVATQVSRAASRNVSIYQNKPFRRFAAPASIAACLAIFALLFWDLLVISIQADHRTAVGEQASVVLPDGSTVFLNTNTAITIDFGQNQRRINLLQGEAFFEVAHDQNSPFRVYAGQGVIEAVGTAFIISNHISDNDNSYQVLVTEGIVKLTSPYSSDEMRDQVLIESGYKSQYVNGQSPSSLTAVNVTKAMRWKGGVIEINNLSIKEAIAELDRYHPGKTLLMADSAHFDLVGGAFDVNSPETALVAIAATHNLTVSNITPYLRIVHE